MSIINKILDPLPRSEKELIAAIKDEYDIADLSSLDGSIIFGAQQLGRDFLRFLKNIDLSVIAFADNDPGKWGKAIDGIPVIPPKDIPKRGPGRVIVASKFVKEICGQLNKSGLGRVVPHYVLSVAYTDAFPNPFYRSPFRKILANADTIDRVWHMLHDEKSREVYFKLMKFRITLSPFDLPDMDRNIYFPGSFWKLGTNETFVDVGAYSGDTLKDFLRHTKGRFHKYYALEPDPENFKQLKENIPRKYIRRIMPLNFGAGDRNTSLFLSTEGERSKISSKGGRKIRILKLDDLLRAEKVDTIKMDVEGYESRVIAGAVRTITRDAPKIAISVYHDTEDLWKLPLKIASFGVHRKYYLRHHSPEIYDTVLYAV